MSGRKRKKQAADSADDSDQSPAPSKKRFGKPEVLITTRPKDIVAAENVKPTSTPVRVSAATSTSRRAPSTKNASSPSLPGKESTPKPGALIKHAPTSRSQVPHEQATPTPAAKQKKNVDVVVDTPVAQARIAG
ncbi:hypothetical protein OH76DRAFT_1488409, partial [Lentinus brumalis]